MRLCSAARVRSDRAMSRCPSFRTSVRKRGRAPRVLYCMLPCNADNTRSAKLLLDADHQQRGVT
jgi:hypothetical protein